MMKFQLLSHKDWWFLTVITLCLVQFALSGCAMVGPRSISFGRAEYSEAINRTEDNQMLMAIVKGCYGETVSLLAVSSVSANVRFSANAGVEIGDRWLNNANVVPLSGGMAYEENPTITYALVQGEQYYRQLLSPIPLDILALTVSMEIDPAALFITLVDRVNDLRNPHFFHSPSAEPDPRFHRFVELDAELRKADILDWVADPNEKGRLYIRINSYVPAHVEKVREYLTLTGLPTPIEEGQDVILPVHFGVRGPRSQGIAISMRSTFDLIQILRAATDIPQEHADAGLAIDYPTLGPAGKGLRIHSSKDEPEGAIVAVKHRGYWFYINDSDMHTKLFYKTIRALWSTRIAASVDGMAAPVLTIPVSR
jgi:hypothetical protein